MTLREKLLAASLVPDVAAAAGVAAVLADPDAFADPPSLTARQRRAWRTAQADGTTSRRLDAELEALSRLGAHWLCPADDAWDARWPVGVLRVRGALPTGRRLAVVGARRADPYGLEIAERVATAAARAGVTVVSGGAFGVDITAHRVALALGRTVVVLGSGLERPAPTAHLEVFRGALDGGAVVSPFQCDQAAARWTFPRRNPWIAALSEQVVVVQASARSGALYTARAAFEQGKPVWAVPGPMDSPLHAGCHALVGEGARLLGGLADLELPEARAVAASEPSEGGALWRVAGAEPTPLDELARRAGMAVGEAARAATLLELDGWLRSAPGGRYARARPRGAE